MVPTVGAAGAAAAGAGAGSSAARGGGGAGGTAWAARGTAHPPSIVPTRNIAPPRLLKLILPEITRPRLLRYRASARSAPSPCYSPAPTLLSNQALKPVPQ